MISATISKVESAEKKYPPRNRKAKRPWSDAETIALIEGYEANECLWDPNAKRHRNRDIIIAARNDIARKTKHCVEDVKAQWNNVKTRFNKERRKELNLKSGHAGSNRPTWQFYRSMMFMAHTVTEAGKTSSNLKFNTRETTSSFSSPKSVEYSPNDEFNAFANVHPTKKKRLAMEIAPPTKQRRLTFMEQCMTLLKGSENQKPFEDEWTTTGNFIAAELRSRTRSTALRMKRKLIEVIMQEEFNEDNTLISKYHENFEISKNEDDTDDMSPR